MQTGLPLVSLNAAVAWPEPVQILSLPYKVYNAPVLEAQALYTLNKYHSAAAPQDIGLNQLPVHTFGSLEGLSYMTERESSDFDEKLIAPYLLREGCEGMPMKISKKVHDQHDPAKTAIFS